MALLTVGGALKILEMNGVNMNPPAFRKQLREGKIKGAFLDSKRSGYQIPYTNLMMFIYIKKRDYESIYELGYKKGLEDSQKNK